MTIDGSRGVAQDDDGNRYKVIDVELSVTPALICARLQDALEL